MERPVSKKRNGPEVYVQKTRLGRGVFAGQKMRRGQRIGRIAGRVISDPDYSSDYCMDLADGKVLEPTPPFRYLNHCCLPNCEIVSWEDDQDGAEGLWLYVLRTIHPGDQLTIDYAWAAEVAIPCRCGVPQCRGWIVDAGQLHLLAAPDKTRRPQRSPALAGRIR